MGLAFVAGERELVTCAHVVNAALGRPARAASLPGDGWVQVRFPFAGRDDEQVVRRARVAAWMPRAGAAFEMRDVAGLRLTEDVPHGAAAATLSSDGAGERRVGAWGPNRSDDPQRPGQIVGRLLDRNDRVRFQLDQDLAGVLRVQSGYSGGPVWEQATGQIVGIVQAVPGDDDAVDVLVIGADTLVEAWPEVLYRPPPNPYRGLAAFGEEDAHLFFGRETFVRELVEAVRDEPLIVVAGRSGAGKSSVVAAGLVPALRDGGSWAVGSLRPGADPMYRLAVALAAASGSWAPHPPGEVQRWLERLDAGGLAEAAEEVCAGTGTSRLLLTVDQFEQIYTECRDPERRAAFLDLLTRLATDEPGAVRVALSVRDDFLWDLLEANRALGGYVREHFHALHEMDPGELARAIEEPARVAGGVVFEDGLVRLVQDDFRGRPGALPLLEFTLTRLWERQRGRTLTLAAYQDLGGVTEALAGHAEEQYAALRPAEQDAARRVFTALVQPDRTDVARQVRRTDLRPGDWPAVERLREARLLSVRVPDGGPALVEISHEALLRGWRRLHGWLAEDVELRAWRASVVAARDVWEQHGRHDELLLRGPVLDRARAMAAAHPDDLTGVEEFIAASTARADVERDERERAAREARARGIARRAEDLLTGTAPDQPTALALGIVSLRHAPTFEGDLALRRALAFAKPSETPFPYGDRVHGAAFSADLTMLAAGGDDGSVRVWDLRTGDWFHQVEHGAQVLAVAFSPDGTRLATAGDRRTVHVWDLSTGAVVARIAHRRRGVRAVAFSLDGTRLATGGADVHLLDLGTGTEIAHLAHEGMVDAVAFAPDGARLVTGCTDQHIRLWDVETGAELRRFFAGDSVKAVAFSPDGTRVAWGGLNQAARVWNPETGEARYLAHGSTVVAVAFSPDGTRLASADDDQSAHVWNLADGTRTLRRSLRSWPRALAFAPTGTHLATAGTDRVARLWNLSAWAETVRHTYPEGIASIAFGPEGQLVADVMQDGDGSPLRLPPLPAIAVSPDGTVKATGGLDGTVRVLNLRNHAVIARLQHPGGVYSIAFSPDGSLLATAGWGSNVCVHDLAGGSRVQIPCDGTVFSVAFSPDGTHLAFGGEPGTAHVWSLTTGAETARLPHDGWVRCVTFHPAGTHLGTASHDGTARVWALSPDALIRQASQRLPYNVPPSLWAHHLPDIPYERLRDDLP